MKYPLGIARKPKSKRKKKLTKICNFYTCAMPLGQGLTLHFMCTFLSHFTCDKEIFFRFIYAGEGSKL
jgi:hypothetical protein